ncbi:Set1 complex component spp1 [Spathaspora sp. JA1]|nr:Set1 complex component spp1 [Spathaspora sp. JA1]
MSDRYEEPTYRDSSPDSDPTTHRRKKPSPSYIPTRKHKSTSPTPEETSEELAKQFKKFTNAPKFDLNSEEVFCVCRKPDHGELMVACDGCEEWFHFKCMNVNPKYSNLIAKFYCKFCQWKGIGVSKWKRKCRLESCYEAIKSESKYCSEDHGKLFLKQVLLGTSQLSTGVVKDILDFVGQDHAKFNKLGDKFPELGVVNQYRIDEKLESFPDDVKSDLQMISTKYTNLNNLINQENLKLSRLIETKENIKTLNERLISLIYPDQETSISKTKKPKRGGSNKKKKIDLCYHDKLITYEDSLISQIINNDELYESLSQQIKRRYNVEDDDEQEEQEISDTFQDRLCIKDKRKCPRHNGWWNLAYDEISKRLSELTSRLELLKQQRETILRNYSIEVYEN